MPASEPINQIKLNFKQKNFDWKVKLEGSQNLTNWFTIADNYRVLSIKNEITDFQFTDVLVPNSQYRYYRLSVPGKLNPELMIASIERQEITEGTYRDYAIRKLAIHQNKETKQTEITIELPQPVPVSQVKIGVKDRFDYYRPITIEYLADSVKYEHGWELNYGNLASGTLNSLEKNEFHFNSVTTQKLKVLISNFDNRPLNIDTINLSGYVYELVARFTEPANYFLAYGNKAAEIPNYDIDRFTDKVPAQLKILELGNEQTIPKQETRVTEPLFRNKQWLWIIMAIIILLLGWFSVKMIQGK